jgi:hypothetical protein
MAISLSDFSKNCYNVVLFMISGFENSERRVPNGESMSATNSQFHDPSSPAVPTSTWYPDMRFPFL